jgi:hypothetical protein
MPEPAKKPLDEIEPLSAEERERLRVQLLPRPGKFVVLIDHCCYFYAPDEPLPPDHKIICWRDANWKRKNSKDIPPWNHVTNPPRCAGDVVASASEYRQLSFDANEC